jgi:hypothetical protein
MAPRLRWTAKMDHYPVRTQTHTSRLGLRMIRSRHLRAMTCWSGGEKEINQRVQSVPRSSQGGILSGALSKLILPADGVRAFQPCA